MVLKILFNLVEIVCTILFGLLLKTRLLTVVMILITWMIARILVEGPMHYKSPIKCFFMTIFLFISIFIATKVHIYLGIICVIFDAIIMSKYGNVKDTVIALNDNIFQWNNFGSRRKSKYQDLIELINKEPENPIILKYEKYWKKNYKTRYKIFVMFYRNRMTYDQIKKKFKVKDNALVKDECKIIYSTLEIPLNLKSL